MTVLIGFFTGILSGIFGIGGALLSTPAIRLVLHVKPLIAVGTTLPVIIPTATTAGIVYFRNGYVEKRAIMPTATAGILGAILGSLATAVISGNYLLIITALLIFAVGIQFIYRQRTLDTGKRDNTPASILPLKEGGTKGGGHLTAKYVLTGLLVGFIGGLLGIGGGIILIPLFVFVLRIPLKKAFGTSLIIIAIMAVPGSVIHYLLGHIDVYLALLLAVGVIPGSYLGARITYLAKAKSLALAFGLIVILIAVWLGLNEVLLIV